mgnify:CR=1 FL=1
MIKINLLPETAKKQQKSKKPFEFEMPKIGPEAIKAGIGFLSVLLAGHLLLGLSILLKEVSLNKLEAKWQQLSPRKKDVDKVKEEVEAVEKMVAPVRMLVNDRMSWSKILNQLSNLITPGVWLTKLYVQTQISSPQKGEYARSLNIEGCAASLYGDETSLAAKFTKALQDDKEFLGYFSEIKLGPMEKNALENIPVMNFQLFCLFKDED